MPNFAALRAAVFPLSTKKPPGGGYPPPPSVRGFKFKFKFNVFRVTVGVRLHVRTCKASNVPRAHAMFQNSRD